MEAQYAYVTLTRRVRLTVAAGLPTAHIQQRVAADANHDMAEGTFAEFAPDEVTIAFDDRHFATRTVDLDFDTIPQ